MEKNVKVSILCEIYGKLLTEKQLAILDDYYNQDLSLSEIAENSDITRQAVRDIIKKGETKLFEFEEKLEFMKKMLKQEEKISTILSELLKIQNKFTDGEVAEVLENVKQELTLMYNV
ncbi:MAG: putative DNA-binding protein [Oscillospiraceae bacterium]|nr:putative DNA-binding protein [Oscillospiraceae bacterium]